MLEDKKLVRIPLSRQVLNRMEELINSGEWAVGAKIPPEAELMRLFGVSRNTVREAVQSLGHSGLLAIRPGDGTYVMAKSQFDVMMNNRLRVAGDRSILEARLALEKEISRLAAQNRSDDDLVILQELLVKRNQELNDDPEADYNFHCAVATATHNPLLAELYTVIGHYLLETMRQWLQIHHRQDEEITLHNALYQAIANGDSDAAEELTVRIVKLNQGEA